MTTLPPPAAFPGQAAPPAPPHTLTEGRDGRTLAIGAWTVETAKRPILNIREVDAAAKALSLPLPEMTFGNNALVLTHASGVGLRFDALGALALVATGEGWEERVGGGVLVAVADKWSQGRAATSALSDVPLSTKPVRPHDWTFSSCYTGEVAGPSSFTLSETHEIPMRLLARQDPVMDRILFYDDVALFEDELHDNGESILNVRIRVMPHSFFVLSRLFVRVDHVLFRIFDVRVYHAFGADEVIREVSGYEADYDEVKKYLQKPGDLSPLADANFVHQTLGKIAARAAAPSTAMPTTTTAPTRQVPSSTMAAPAAMRATVAPTVAPARASPAAADQPERPPLAHQSSSRTRGKPWPGLGRRVDVLRLPKGESALESARAGLEKLAV